MRSLVAAAVLTLVAMIAAPTGAPAISGSSASVSVDPRVGSVVADAGRADVIVRVLPGTEAEVGELIAAHAGEVTRYLPVAESLSASVGETALDALERRADLVVGVTLDGPVGVLHDAPDGSPYSDSTFGRTVGADELNGQGIDGSGVGIAMIDTGVNEVTDLRGRVVHGVDLSGELDGVDRFGHGTFVAGIIAGDGASSDGAYRGVAPGAHVVSIKIAGEDGSSDVSSVLAALQWAIEFKDHYDIEVLNLPIGTDSTQPWTVDPLNHAVEHVWQAGIVVVVAAGNHGPDDRTILKPGDDPYVLTAGATDFMSTVERVDDIVPGFSSRGPTVHGVAKPDLVAPGAHLVGLRAEGSTIDLAAPYARLDEHYFRGSGTSFSAAVVSGAAALVKDAHPDWTPDQVKGALLATAADGPTGDAAVDGAGALDVLEASTLADPPTANQDLTRMPGAAPVPVPDGSHADVAPPDGWQGHNWQGHNWQGHNWQGHNWQGHNWQGHNWQGHNWQGHNWQGHNWQGHNWQGLNWQGLNWQ